MFFIPYIYVYYCYCHFTLPSLRRLFEIAVGASDASSLPLPRSAPVEEITDSTQTVADVKPRAPGSHSTRTLGHHVDTPALAPFLGRAPQKRFMHVYDENDPVDIFGDPNPAASGVKRDCKWRMPFSQRNLARRELDEQIDHPILDAGKLDGPRVTDSNHRVSSPNRSEPHAGLTSIHSLFSSRFHIAARICIADYSLWLPPGRFLCLHDSIPMTHNLCQSDVPRLHRIRHIDGVSLSLHHLMSV